MKTFAFSICLLFSSLALYSQDYWLYWKYKDYDGISLTVPSIAIDMGSWFVDEKEDRVLLRKINKVRLMVFEDYSPITKKDLKRFDKKAKRKHLEELVYVRQGKMHVRIMAKESKNAIRKVVVLVQSPEEFVFVSVKGRFRWDDINRVIEKYGNEKKDDGEPLMPPGVKIPVYKI